MRHNLAKLMSITKRSDAISAQTKITMLEFDAALQADDRVKQEEARVKLHQLIDDQLDLQMEVNVFKEQQITDIVKRMNNQKP